MKSLVFAFAMLLSLGASFGAMAAAPSEVQVEAGKQSEFKMDFDSDVQWVALTDPAIISGSYLADGKNLVLNLTGKVDGFAYVVVGFKEKGKLIRVMVGQPAPPPPPPGPKPIPPLEGKNKPKVGIQETKANKDPCSKCNGNCDCGSRGGCGCEATTKAAPPKGGPSIGPFELEPLENGVPPIPSSGSYPDGAFRVYKEFWSTTPADPTKERPTPVPDINSRPTPLQPKAARARTLNELMGVALDIDVSVPGGPQYRGTVRDYLALGRDPRNIRLGNGVNLNAEEKEVLVAHYVSSRIATYQPSRATTGSVATYQPASGVPGVVPTMPTTLAPSVVTLPHPAQGRGLYAGGTMTVRTPIPAPSAGISGGINLNGPLGGSYYMGGSAGCASGG